MVTVTEYTLRKPVDREALSERFDTMWDELRAAKKRGEYDSMGYCEGTSANPAGMPPWFAIDAADRDIRRNPKLLTEYDETEGLPDVRETVAEYIKELDYQPYEHSAEDVNGDNVMMIPGI